MSPHTILIFILYFSLLTCVWSLREAKYLQTGQQQVANTALFLKQVKNEVLVPSDRNRFNIVPVVFSAVVFETLPAY
jgi:hypothetical protein